MRRILLLLFGICSCMLYAQRVTLDFDNTSLAEALRQIDHAQQDKHLVFVFNDLENLCITQSIRHKDAMDAVRQACQGFPILISENEDNIFIEYIKPPMHLLPVVSVSGRQIKFDEAGYTIATNVTGLGITDLLTSQPNITMRDGKIYLNGQPVKQIYLNGMPLSDQSELLQLTSDVIAKVRADYQNNALYITLRRPSKSGYYGFAHVGYEFDQNGDFEDQLGSILYVRRNKTSFYDKVGIHAMHRDTEVEHKVWTPTAGSDYRNCMKEELADFNNRFSVLHEFSEHHNIGVSHYIYSHNNKSRTKQSAMAIFEDYNGKNAYIDNELTLRYAGDLTPRHIRIDMLADYFSRHSTSENISLYGAGVGTEQNEAPSINIWKVAADVQHPVRQNLMLKYGWDVSMFSMHYKPTEFLSNVKGFTPVLDELDKEGKMFRLYLNADWKIGALKLEAGLAPQWHQSDYDERATNPHLRLFLPWGHRHNLTFSLQQEMEEMPYALLSPAIRWSDANNFSVGNEELRSAKPTTAMVHASLWQSRLLITASYRKVKDEIYWLTHHNEEQTNMFYTRPINLKNAQHVGLQTESNLHPTDWWQFKVNAQFDLRLENETLNGTVYKGNHLLQHYSCINQFRFPKNWAITLNGFYQPKFETFDREYRAIYRVRGEVQKSFLDNKFQCALVAQPLHQNRGLIRTSDSYVVSDAYLNDIQTIGFRFVYNFRGKTRVKVGTVEGGLKYNDIKDNSL